MQDSIFTMPTLPTELIIEILSRVSVKSLLKFRCVSKSWLALIRSPQFVKTHVSVSAKNKDYTHHRLVLTEVRNFFTSHDVQYILKDCSLSSLRNDSVIEPLDLNYPMKNPQLNVCVVGSVNGLICLDIEENDLVLWNPSLRLYKKLPDSRLKVSGGSHIDRATSVIYGFGYDESSDDYKVVGVLCMERRCTFHHLEVKIYSLKSNSWRSKDGIPDGVQLIRPCMFLNGKLHLAGELNVGFHKDRNIVSIDLTDEKWGKLEQPLYVEGNFFVKLEVLGSDLSVFCNYIESHADVWVMREYGVKESWTKTYTIKYPTYHWSPFISQRLCMSNKGDILLVPGSTLMVHNPEDEPIRYPKVTKFGFCTAVNIYIESLVCAPLFGMNKA
ncbi:F-box/kelch-repeat protein At3g23880-like [Solanum dulcamara]|uniref:F-box/kelch-repeat protein At3g23880-like n=1 Tax=Solanum dulcamara TaxID=45834 RepID=UPI002485EE00|nr:F-box/kelch-repeat protein At3g23880-like [Solanum dulcamara]